MTEIQDRFLSYDEKTQVFYRIWQPEGEVKAVLQISHGMMEHTGRYEDFAAHLCERGFAVAGNDHLGHGKTAPDAESLGYFTEAGGSTALIEDLHTLTGILKDKYKGKPVILLGHSMGSFLARLYISEFAEDIDAAIIMGTAGPGAPTGLAIFLVDMLSIFRGEHHRSKLITALAFGNYNKRIKKPRPLMAWLTKDNTILEKRDKDNDCNFIFTLSAYRDLFEMLEIINNEEWPKTVTNSLPLLLVSGAEDPVGAYGEGVKKVASMLSVNGSTKLTLRLFAGDRHEILNETDKADVYAYIDSWLDGILEGLAAEKADT